MTKSQTLNEFAKAFVKAVTGDKIDAELQNSSTTNDALDMLGAFLEAGPDGNVVGAKEPAYLHIADIYARLAERAGKSEELRAFVPEAGRTEEVRTALAEQAPAFSKLCV